MTREHLASGRVTLFAGDCLDVLAGMDENSVDAVVTDPPYHLTSVVKRFGTDNAAPAQFGTDGAFARASRGFMGKTWDGGDVAFRPETWAAVMRVMKPGGHMLACGGTRTYHRMVCAIEDAGFEVRDCVLWVYGSGFNKVGYIRDSEGQIVKEGWAGSLKPAVELICLARKPLSERTVAANVIAHGTGAIHVDACRVGVCGQDDYGRSAANANGTVNAHNGFDGKSFKISERDGEYASPLGRWPANLIHDGSDEVLAAFPETTSGLYQAGSTPKGNRSFYGNDAATGYTTATDTYNDSGSAARFFKQVEPDAPLGRWPANLIHDGSPEVLAAFPETEPAKSSMRGELHGSIYGGGEGPSGPSTMRGHEDNGGSAARFFKQVEPDKPRGTGGIWSPSSGLPCGPTYNDSGSAGRFFKQVEPDAPSRIHYSSKADFDDRLGSSHPTVKPVNLIQYLARLITPPGGLILDPFAGTGTLGEAAIREGFRAVLIEREAEYCADIRRRMALASAGPVERRHESIKARGKVDHDAGPLFAQVEAAE